MPPQTIQQQFQNQQQDYGNTRKGPAKGTGVVATEPPDPVKIRAAVEDSILKKKGLVGGIGGVSALERMRNSPAWTTIQQEINTAFQQALAAAEAKYKAEQTAAIGTLGGGGGIEKPMAGAAPAPTPSPAAAPATNPALVDQLMAKFRQTRMF